MVIKLTPDLEAALKDASQTHGVAPETLALDALRKQFLHDLPLLESRDEWERTLRGLASDCGVALSNAALSSEGMYE